ncbi:MAG: hypothetical protein LBG76_02625 [Treponema sp.]|jgi:hypothetical protein|nr:hypothetical protein [Treponema sp.]
MGLLSKAASIGAAASAAAGSADSEVPDFIANYHRKNAEFQGIVLDLPQEDDARAGFFERVAVMTAPFAAARLLPSGRCLLLFGKSLDRELIGHRASKSLNTDVSLTFEANEVQDAFALIQPYL